MKKLLPLVLLLLLLGATVAGWFLFGKSDAPKREALALGDQPAVVVAESPATPDLVEPKVAPPVREEVVTPASTGLAKAAPVQELGPSVIWVEGRVEFPPETPVDEVAFVVAKGKKLGGKKSSREHKVRVGQDGRFRVPFGKGTKKARLMLEARYLRLDATHRFSPNPEEEVVLKPGLGGRIVVSVARADGAVWSDADAEGFTVSALNRTDGNWKTIYASPVLLPDNSESMDRFEFGGVAPGDQHDVSTSSDTFVSEDKDEVSASPGETVEIAFSLRVGARIEGKVVDFNGLPVPNAGIRCQYAIDKFSQTEFIQTDELGAFSRGGLEPAETTLEATADGFLDNKMDLGKLKLGETISGLVFELGSGESITGRVLWPDGTAVADAAVRMSELGAERRWWDDDANLKTETDATGAFEFTGLAGDESYRVYTRAKRTKELELEGLSQLKRKRAIKGAPYWNAEVEQVAAGAAEVILTLRSGATFTGTVVDDAGVPLDDFRVTARPAENERAFIGGASGESVSQGFRDAEGRFDLAGLKPGEWVLSVRQRGYGSAQTVTARVPAGPLSGEFVLYREAVVRGRVLDPNGKPVPDATVECERVGGGSIMAMSADSDDESKTKTDDEGNFELKRVPAGRVSFTAEGPGSDTVAALPQRLEIAAASEVDDVVFQLRRASRVLVRVHPSLAGRSDLQVNMNERGGPIWRNEQVNDSGTCLFEGLNPGKYTVTLEIPAPEDGTASLLPEGEREEERTLDLEVAEGADLEVTIGEPASVTYTIAGTVLRGGVPYEGALVHIKTSEDDRSYGAQAGSGGEFSAQVERMGVVTFTVREPGKTNGVRFDRTLEAKGLESIVLDVPLGVIRGVVMNSSGKPDTDCTVVLSEVEVEGDPSRPKIYQPVDTNELGEFEFVGLVDGEYSLSSAADRFAWWDEPDEDEVIDAPGFLPSVKVDASAVGATVVELRRKEGGVLTGIVTRADGSTSAGFMVYLVGTDGEPDWRVMARVGRGGIYKLRGLPEGSLKIGIRDRQGDLTESETRIFLGQDNVLDFTVD